MTSFKWTFGLGGALAAVVLSACSGTGTSPSPTGAQNASSFARSSSVRHGWMTPDVKNKKLVYASDYTGSAILIYPQGENNPQPIGEIVTGISNPHGIAVNKAGTLYVTNQGNNTLTEYPAGATSPSVTLSNGISKPSDVSVNGNGTAYISESANNLVLEYKVGSTSPDVSISMPRPDGLINDKKNNVYLTSNVSSTGAVYKCPPLSTSCTNLGFATQVAADVILDKQANRLVGDYFAPAIYVYAPGATSPTRTITTYEEDPYNFALDKTDTNLYMADPANFSIDLYTYATGAQWGTISNGVDELEGVALFPGQKAAKSK